MKKLSKDEFIAKYKAEMLAKEQARIDAATVVHRYVMDRSTKRLRAKKKYMMEK